MSGTGTAWCAECGTCRECPCQVDWFTTNHPETDESARVHELARAGLLVNAGKRRRTRAGRMAVVFVVQGTKLKKVGT